MIIENGQARAAVVAEAMSWVGTPYHHHARIKGVGVDCAQILIAVYAAAGVVPAMDVGHYPTDWMLHRSEEVFAGWIEQAGAAPVDEPQPGDIALFKFGRCFSHGAIVIGPQQVVHACITAGRVCTLRTHEAPLAGREVRFYSPWASHE